MIFSPLNPKTLNRKIGKQNIINKKILVLILEIKISNIIKIKRYQKALKNAVG